MATKIGEHIRNGNTTVTSVSPRAFLKPTVTVVTVGEKYRETEQLYGLLSDLVNDRFKPWYCKRFHSLGKAEVLKRAAIARSDGLQPSKLFSKLLKAS